MILFHIHSQRILDENKIAVYWSVFHHCNKILKINYKDERLVLANGFRVPVYD
jgi:hypothetical protein